MITASLRSRLRPDCRRYDTVESHARHCRHLREWTPQIATALAIVPPFRRRFRCPHRHDRPESLAGCNCSCWGGRLLPIGFTSGAMQARFDAFVQEFNTERPHEALAMKAPAQVYSASPRSYSG